MDALGNLRFNHHSQARSQNRDVARLAVDVSSETGDESNKTGYREQGHPGSPHCHHFRGVSFLRTAVERRQLRPEEIGSFSLA